MGEHYILRYHQLKIELQTTKESCLKEVEARTIEYSLRCLKERKTKAHKISVGLTQLLLSICTITDQVKITDQQQRQVQICSELVHKMI